MNENLSPQRRDGSIDLLKTIAVFCVILIHSASTAMYGELSSADWYSGVFWGCVSRFAVPVFFMCSGALMLRPEKELSLKRLWGKNLLRIVLAMLFWAFAYKCLHLLAAGDLSLPALWQAVKEILLFNQEFHLYYLHIILLIYALLPILRLITASADKRLLQYLLVLWLALGIVFSSLRPYWPFSLLDGIPVQWIPNLTYSSIGYCFLGYYMKSYPPRKRCLYIAAFALGFALTFGATLTASLKNGVLFEDFLAGTSIGVCLMAAGLFGLCLGFSPSERAGRFYTHISKASFCIYLVHAFFLPYAQSAVSAGFMPAALSVPLFSALNAALCLLAYEVLSRIPFVNKWLI